ncbi:hypothetical protein QZH41_006186 [Actinostola sp. cb2023]|nr:hypothetical protein QZH41_006186 [Actinostola sp. cb2023]
MLSDEDGFRHQCHGYFLHDFTTYIKISRSNLDSGLCKLGLNKKIATNCYLRVIAEGSLMCLAVLTLVLACWCAVCCCFSFCGGSSVEPEESSEEEQVLPPRVSQPYPSQSMPMQNAMEPKMPNSNLPVMACIAVPMATSMQAMPNHVIPMTPYNSGMYPSIPVGYPSAVPMPYVSGYVPGIADRLEMTVHLSSFPAKYLLAIWMGGWILLAGVIGMYSSLRVDAYEPNAKKKIEVIVYLVFTIVAIVFTVALIVCYSVSLALSANNEGSCTKCPISPCPYKVTRENKCNVRVTLAVLVMFASVLEIASALWTLIGYSRFPHSNPKPGIADRLEMTEHLSSFPAKYLLAIWMGGWILVTGIIAVFISLRGDCLKRTEVIVCLVFTIVAIVFAVALIVCYSVSVALIARNEKSCKVTPVLMNFNGGFSCLEIISKFVERECKH